MDEVIEIPVADAQMIRAALNSAYHHNTVIDLAEQYRKLTQRSQASKLTQSLENAIALLQAHIERAQDEEEPPDEQ